MTLNEEQYKYLEELEIHLHHALYEGYCRIINRDVLKVMDSIYQDIFKSKSKMLDGCSRCILYDIKKLADIYFKDKKEKESEEAKNIAIEEPIEEPVEEETPKKMSQYSYGKKATKTNAAKTKKTNNKK